MEPATALSKQDVESPGENATSTSGVRTIALPSEHARSVTPTLPGLRGIVVTPEATPSAPDPNGGTSPSSEPERFQVEFAYDTQFFAGLSRDVSKGGIIITTYRDLPVGTRVHLDFELPNGVPVEARGEVRWIREDGTAARRSLAIAFTELDERSLRGISDYCQVHPPLFVDLDT